MQAKVDWLAWTIPTDSLFEHSTAISVMEMRLIVSKWSGGLLKPIISPHSWEIKQGRRFYHTTASDEKSKLIFSCGNVNTHIYVEAGGVACDNIRASGLFDDLIKAIATRASRVDLAIDFECDVQPADFVVKSERSAYKGSSDIRSAQGNTYYVGSRKSEQFARVYRYHDPHPRSHLLRVEVELKGAKAKSCCQAISDRGLLQTIADANRPYKWSHPIWQLDTLEVSRIKGKVSDREKASTVRWLIGTCASSLVKAHSTGLIDAREWFETYVASKLTGGKAL